jgi:GxxExxY protein
VYRDEGGDVTRAVIGAAIEVHRQLGPGLLESAYDACFGHEMFARGIPFRRQVGLPVEFKEVTLDCGYRVDHVVDGSVVVELKAVTALEPVHEAQLLTYMKLGGWSLGLLINFNVEMLKNGIRRRALSASLR